MGVDDRLAEAERRWREAPEPQAEARWIRECLRSGAVTAERVALCAELGHEAAWLALGCDAPAPPEDVEAWALALGADDDAVRLRAAIAALRAMPIHWDRFDGPDDRLLAAIDAIEQWARDPSEQHARAVRAIADAADGNSWGWRRYGAFGIALAMCASIGEDPLADLGEAPPPLEEVMADALRSAAGALHFGRLRQALAEDLVPWALGRSDPLGGRSRERGERLGSADGIVRRVAFAPDGRTALSTDGRGWLHVWAIDPPGLRFTHPRRAHDLYAAAWSPDGKRILIADRWGRIELWDALGERPEPRLAFADEESPEDARQINDLVFASDGAHAFTAGYDGTVRRWDLGAGRLLEVVGRLEKSVVAVALSGSRSRLAGVGADGSVAVWDLGADGFEQVGRIASGCASAQDGELLGPEGDRVVVAGYDGAITVFEVATGERVASLEGHESSVYAIAASPDGELLASTGSDDTVRLWETRTGVERERWKAPGVQLAIAFSPDAGRVLVGARSGALRLFRVAGGPAEPAR